MADPSNIAALRSNLCIDAEKLCLLTYMRSSFFVSGTPPCAAVTNTPLAPRIWRYTSTYRLTKIAHIFFRKDTLTWGNFEIS
jgi:hypothetical protein